MRIHYVCKACAALLVMSCVAGSPILVGAAPVSGLKTAIKTDTLVKVMQVKKVSSRQERNKKLKDDIAQYVKKFSVDAPTIDLIGAIPPNQTFFDYVNGRFSGLTINRGPNGNFIFKGRGQASLDSRNSTDSSDDVPLFYIDEAMVDIDDIRSINLNNIALIRFAQAPVWFAPLNGGAIGAVLIYMKKTDSSDLR